MTTRSQKRKAVAELVSGDFEASIAENTPSENLIAGPSKIPRVEPENLEEIKTSLRKIMSDLTKILAENQMEMLKLMAPLNKKQPVCSNIQDFDSEPENISVARTSTPVKAYTATSSKTTPNKKTVPLHEKFCSHPNRRHSHLPTYFQCRKHSRVRFQFSMVSPTSLNFLSTYSEITSNIPSSHGDPKNELLPFIGTRERTPSVL